MYAKKLEISRSPQILDDIRVAFAARCLVIWEEMVSSRLDCPIAWFRAKRQGYFDAVHSEVEVLHQRRLCGWLENDCPRVKDEL